MHIPEVIKTYGLIAILIIVSFWFASRFIEPPPPNRIVLAAGAADGEYYRYAQLYKAVLAEEGIEVAVLETAGSLENANLLLEEKADAAFIQSGLATEERRQAIEALGSLYYEPLWVFTRDGDFKQKDLQNLAGKKLAIGSAGSGTQAIARQLLALNDLKDESLLTELSSSESAEALMAGNVEAAFFVGRSRSPAIHSLLMQKDVYILGFDRASGYTRRLPFLSKVELGEGAIDMADDIPARDVVLLSPVAQLTVRKDFNGALKTLLVSKAIEIHGAADLFSAHGDFPTLAYTDFPVADEAKRYFEYGPNVLQRVLPFWLADMISRMVVLLIPLLGVMLPLLKIASPTYRWRTRSRIYRWYKRLKNMEEDALKDEANVSESLSALERIDADVKKTKVPLSYADELYNLRLHIRMIKEHLQKSQEN